MLSVVEISRSDRLAICLMVVGLLAGTMATEHSSDHWSPATSDRINAIKEAIDILQQELADLEAIEHEARTRTAGARVRC